MYIFKICVLNFQTVEGRAITTDDLQCRCLTRNIHASYFCWISSAEFPSISMHPISIDFKTGLISLLHLLEQMIQTNSNFLIFFFYFFLFSSMIAAYHFYTPSNSHQFWLWSIIHFSHKTWVFFCFFSSFSLNFWYWFLWILWSNWNAFLKLMPLPRSAGLYFHRLASWLVLDTVCN